MKHVAQCPALLKCSVNVKFSVSVIELPGNAVGAPVGADYQLYSTTRLKPWPVACSAEAFRESRGRKELDPHIPVFPRFSTRSVLWPLQLEARPGVPRPVPACGSSGPAPWIPQEVPCHSPCSKEGLGVQGQPLESGVSSLFLMPFA